MSARTATATAPSRGRLRLSGSDEAPRARGLVHLGGLLLALPAGAVLVWHEGAGGGVAVYAVGLVALYAVSASYHLCPWSPAARRRMRQLDHAMIFVFIAASVTPYCLLAVPGALGAVVLWLVWLGAGAAVLAVACRFEASHRHTSVAYVALGWLAAVTLSEAAHHLSAREWALLGSLAFFYTAGAGVLARRWPDPAPKVFGYHEVWHSMVVLASACGYVLVWSLAASHH